MRQLPIPYQRNVSPEAFGSKKEASSGMPYRTTENKKKNVFSGTCCLDFLPVQALPYRTRIA